MSSREAPSAPPASDVAAAPPALKLSEHATDFIDTTSCTLLNAMQMLLMTTMLPSQSSVNAARRAVGVLAAHVAASPPAFQHAFMERLTEWSGFALGRWEDAGRSSLADAVASAKAASSEFVSAAAKMLLVKKAMGAMQTRMESKEMAPPSEDIKFMEDTLRMFREEDYLATLSQVKTVFETQAAALTDAKHWLRAATKTKEAASDPDEFMEVEEQAAHVFVEELKQCGRDLKAFHAKNKKPQNAGDVMLASCLATRTVAEAVLRAAARMDEQREGKEEKSEAVESRIPKRFTKALERVSAVVDDVLVQATIPAAVSRFAECRGAVLDGHVRSVLKFVQEIIEGRESEDEGDETEAEEGEEEKEEKGGGGGGASEISKASLEDVRRYAFANAAFIISDRTTEGTDTMQKCRIPRGGPGFQRLTFKLNLWPRTRNADTKKFECTAQDALVKFMRKSFPEEEGEKGAESAAVGASAAQILHQAVLRFPACVGAHRFLTMHGLGPVEAASPLSSLLPDSLESVWKEEAGLAVTARGTVPEAPTTSFGAELHAEFEGVAEETVGQLPGPVFGPKAAPAKASAKGGKKKKKAGEATAREALASKRRARIKNKTTPAALVEGLRGAVKAESRRTRATRSLASKTKKLGTAQERARKAAELVEQALAEEKQAEEEYRAAEAAAAEAEAKLAELEVRFAGRKRKAVEVEGGEGEEEGGEGEGGEGEVEEEEKMDEDDAGDASTDSHASPSPQSTPTASPPASPEKRGKRRRVGRSA